MSNGDLRVTGRQLGASGIFKPETCGITGADRVNDAHARFMDATLSGNVYYVANQAGITTQAGLSATTPALTLFNPTGNTYNAVLWYAGCVLAVANAAASVIWVGANTNLKAADVTGTATTAHRNGLLGTGGQPSVQPLLAATLPAAPVAIATIGIGLTGAITTLPAYPAIGRWFDGSIVVAPGTAISFQTSTASGSNSFFGEFIWEEVPIHNYIA